MKRHATPERPAPWWAGLIGLLGYAIVAGLATGAVYAALTLLFSMGQP